MSQRKFKRNGNLLGGCKEGDFEQIVMEEERAYLCWSQASWYFCELFVVVVKLKLRTVAALFVPSV